MKSYFITILCAATALTAAAQNPIIHDQFTADPTARVFDGRLYLYPSHDIPSPVDHLKEWFCMADYHVFSSDNLVDWTDHGVIIDQTDVPWGRPDAYSMWAPDCVCKDGKYYFYFPDAPAGVERGFGVGVAVSDSPTGPFTPMPHSMEGIMGIDPCVLIDDDGQSYIYWAGMGIRGAKLKDNMTELSEEGRVMEGLPEGFKEGPYVFKRDGRYYLTFPWVRDVTETLAYAMSESPLGPWEFKGLIMAESPTECWTNHHSLVEFDGQWYLFYHHNDYSPDMDKRRSARIDRVAFNDDGTIQQVTPTLRGVGIADARKPVHIDRYSQIGKGARIEFIDTLQRFDGWKTVFPKKGAYVRFDDVNFCGNVPLTAKARVKSAKGARLLIDVIGTDGSVRPVATIDVPKSREWTIADGVAQTEISGTYGLLVTVAKGEAEVDYIVFDDAGIRD